MDPAAAPVAPAGRAVPPSRHGLPEPGRGMSSVSSRPPEEGPCGSGGAQDEPAREQPLHKVWGRLEELSASEGSIGSSSGPPEQAARAAAALAGVQLCDDSSRSDGERGGEASGGAQREGSGAAAGAPAAGEASAAGEATAAAPSQEGGSSGSRAPAGEAQRGSRRDSGARGPEGAARQRPVQALPLLCEEGRLPREGCVPVLPPGA
ncbi:unnamed protein product [Prorocentrum cordatum]|uniref:Uncharacterized protein n=1 Tax=Prorocentrum cordatum TaxID=2364126 RepID=A0ABN9URH8_9DINO|nr:unnamed protein product [Polarella glacialis]